MGRPSRPLLLVDDDEDSRFLFERLCARTKIQQELRVVASGNDALAFFRRCRAGADLWPLVTFLDIKMPELSGFDVLHWLGENRLLDRTAVVMFSSSEEAEDIERALAMGASAYLPKRATAPEIVEVIQRVAGRG